MTRIGIILYLTLATAFGPWLCCCTPGRFPGSPAPTTATPTSSHDCCCCSSAEAPSADLAPEGETAAEGRAPKTPDAPCPCKSGSRNLAALVAAERTIGLEQGRAYSSAYAYDAGMTPCTISPNARAGGSTPGESSAFPFCGRDVLRALHILRC